MDADGGIGIKPKGRSIRGIRYVKSYSQEKGAGSRLRFTLCPFYVLLP